MLLLFFLSWTVPELCSGYGMPIVGEGYDSEWNSYSLNRATIELIEAVPLGESFWLGYGQGEFDWPATVDQVLNLTFYTTDGREHWYEVYAAEGDYYALIYSDPLPRADANGDHYGTHPCLAVRLEPSAYTLLREVIHDSRNP